MAYMSQERKAELAPAMRKVFKKYGVKASVAVDNYSTLVVNVKSSKIDFVKNYNENSKEIKVSDNFSISEHWFTSLFTGEALDFLKELFDAMNNGNHDNTDVMTDYFDVGWYCDVNIGKWDKPYELLS